jgi:hypothetical protein
MLRVSDDRLDAWLIAKGDATRAQLEQLAGFAPVSLDGLDRTALRNVAALLSWQLLRIAIDANDGDGAAVARALLDDLGRTVADMRALRTPVPNRPPAGW